MLPPSVKRALSLSYWLVPALFCLALYWQGLFAWFQQDDFAWLGLRIDVRDGRSILSALFTPLYGQGSLRPLGERAYYVGLSSLFGWNAFPFRLVAFLTAFVNLGLVMTIARRITSSRSTALAAAILWAANSMLFTVMSWSAAYTVLLCGFFLLFALYLFQRYVEAGRRTCLVGCWVVFVTGFGALETNTVFPLLAATYALLFAKRHLSKTLPMFAVSAIYTVAHMIVAPKAAQGVYAIHLDWRMLDTFWRYWRWAFVPVNVQTFTGIPERFVRAGSIAFTVALVAYLGWQVRKRRFAPLWFFAWFVFTLLPVLPVREHLTGYYLTLPAIGLAMLGADAVVQCWQKGGLHRWVAIVLTVFFLTTQLPSARGSTRWWYERSRRGEAFLREVALARQRYPDSTILLTGVDGGLFWNTMVHRALRLFDVGDVWLAPGSEAQIAPPPDAGSVRDLVLAPERVRQEWDRNSLEVFGLKGSRLVRVTATYEIPRSPGESGRLWRVDANDPDQDGRFGSGWYPPEANFRWMARRSVVSLPGPRGAGQVLHLKGYCPKRLLDRGPALLTVWVGGEQAVRVNLFAGDLPLHFQFPLPDSTRKQNPLEVVIEVDRTFRAPPDVREFGLAFGSFEIR